MSWSELSNAAGKGQLQKVKELLATRAATSEELREALAFAVIHDQLEMIRQLVAAGADPNAEGKMSGPALHFASRLSTVELLMSLGADPKLRDAAGGDALRHHLVANGPGSLRKADVEIVRTYLDAGVDVRGGATHFFAACATGHLGVIALLLDRGADPNLSEGRETVFSASLGSGCQPQVLALLARRGLSPGTRWSYAGSKTSLLAELCKAGDLATVSWLLEQGVDPNLEGDLTPLALAEQSGNQVLVDLLLEKGARPLRAALEPKLTAAIDQTEQRALASPAETEARLEYARALKTAGFHAAAACEVFQARTKDEALLALPLTGWRVCAAPLPNGKVLAPRIGDGWWRGAQATDGQRVVPLVFTFGVPCTACDEEGQVTCTRCDGTGSYSSFLDPDHDVDCDVRMECPSCLGTRFVVSAKVRSRGSCKHPKDKVKREAPGISRCEVCSLAARDSRWACASCGLFACSC